MGIEDRVVEADEAIDGVRERYAKLLALLCADREIPADMLDGDLCGVTSEGKPSLARRARGPRRPAGVCDRQEEGAAVGTSSQEEADNAALAEALKGPMGLVHLFELKVGPATEMIVAADAADAVAVLNESEPDEPASSIRCLDQLEPVTLTFDDGTKRTRPAIEWALINGRGPLGGSEY